MQVNSISQYQSLNSVQNVSQGQKPVSNSQAAVSTDTVSISSTAFTIEDKARTVMKDYDLRNMSYTDLVEMGGELVKAGVWTGKDVIKNIPFIATIPGLEPKGLEGTGLKLDPDKPIDFLEYMENEVEKLKEIAPSEKDSIAFLQNRVDRMHDLHHLQS